MSRLHLIIYQHRDSVAMGYPLGSILAGIIMVELENSIVPKLNSHLRFWKRYVDDTLTIVKEGSINQLNFFHPNIQFTFEIESSGRISFLDIVITGKRVTLKQQFTEKVQTQACISTGSHLHPIHGNEVR